MLLGCRTPHRPQGLLEQQAADAAISSREVRILLDDFVVQFADEVEEAADNIMSQTTDREIHRRALMWKINAISACFQAASRSDPLGAFIDVWILNKQSLTFFQSPDIPPSFGPLQPIAVDTAMVLEAKTAGIRKVIGTQIPILETFANAFAEDYPITNLYFERASIATHYTEYMDRIQVSEKAIVDVVSNLDQRLDELHRLSALYGEFLLKQARWQAELLAIDALPEDALRESIASLSQASLAISRIAATTESVPHLVERERQQVRDIIRQERTETLTAVDAMRSETIDQLQQERVAIIDALQTERTVVTREMTEYLEGMLVQAESKAEHKWESLVQQTATATDLLFLRLTELAVIIGCFVLLSLLLFPGRSRPSRRPSRPLSIYSGPVAGGASRQPSPVRKAA